MIVIIIMVMLMVLSCFVWINPRQQCQHQDQCQYYFLHALLPWLQWDFPNYLPITDNKTYLDCSILNKQKGVKGNWSLIRP